MVRYYVDSKTLFIKNVIANEKNMFSEGRIQCDRINTKWNTTGILFNSKISE